MKAILFSLLLFLTLSSKSQYIITSSSNPVIGDIEGYVYTYTTGLNLPISGSNKMWNYSSLNINYTTVPPSGTYIPVSSVPNNTLFNGSTIGLDNGTGNYDVYKINSSTRDVLGTANPTPSSCAVYSNPITLITLPFSFGNSNFDTFGYTTAYSALSGSLITFADGTGTLVIPGYTLNNVLKVSFTYTQTFTYQSNMVTANGVQHSFYSSMSKFPVLTITTSTALQNSVTITDINASINKDFVLGVGIKEATLNDNFSIYPNPTNNETVTIIYNNPNETFINLTLINTFGQIVKETKYKNIVSNENKLILDLKNIPAGIYYLQLKTTKLESIKKLVIE